MKKREYMGNAVGSYAVRAVKDFEPDLEDSVENSLLMQYERVIIESIINSFGLDFIIKDRHGGDVDTIHNVRQIGTDDNMTYKNKANAEAYEKRGAYNSADYHSDKRYIEKNRTVSKQRKAGTLKDAYTGEDIPANGTSDLDHVISAKEIHDDRGRLLTDLKGTDLANSDENLQATNRHTNRTKKADDMDTFLDKHGSEYTEKQKAAMRRKDANARKVYEQKLARAYYTGSQFRKDVAFAATGVGLGMGVRQALGFAFTEIWFSIKDELNRFYRQADFKFEEFISAIGNGIRNGWESAQRKYKELFSKFLQGAEGGVMASLTTTLCNIFFTTAKNTVTIIRQSWASLVEAFKIIFINPDGYLPGDRIKAAVKILAAGASVITGILVTEAVRSTGIGTLPVIGTILPSFCGTFVTGILSCTFLYFLDRSPLIRKLTDFFNALPSAQRIVNYYKQQAAYFAEYAAKLMEIDIEQFKKETALYINLACNLENAKTEQELNTMLYKAAETIGVKIPWRTHSSFDSFMKDKNARMVFE